MRISAALDSIHLGRRTLLLFGTLVVGSYAAYKLAQYVINDDMTGLAYAALCVAGGVIVVAILNNWRNGVYSLSEAGCYSRISRENSSAITWLFTSPRIFCC